MLPDVTLDGRLRKDSSETPRGLGRVFPQPILEWLTFLIDVKYLANPLVLTGAWEAQMMTEELGFSSSAIMALIFNL